MIITPARTIPSIINDYAEKGVKSAMIKRGNIAAESGLSLVQFSLSTEEELSKIYPTLKSNPSDVGALFTQDRLPYGEIIEAVLNDRNVDCVLGVIYVGQLLSPEFYIPILNELKRPEGKPIVFWIYGTNREMMNQTCLKFEENGYPVYLHIETAIKALGAMYQYRKIISRGGESWILSALS